MEEKTIKVDVGRSFKAVLRKWYLVLAAGLVCGMIMYAFKYDTPQYYSATATVYSAASGSYAETTQGLSAMRMYSEVVTSAKLAERAASLVNNSKINSNMVRGMASVSYKDDSPVLYITAKSTNPSYVAPVANALAQSLIIETQSMTGSQAIQILDQAAGVSIIGRGVKRNVAFAALAGMILVSGIIVLVESLSDRVYRVEDAELDGKLEIIGIIPDQKIS